jgi:hypothetical protein
MRCLICRNLELAFEARRNEYIQASSLAYVLVSKKFAAYKNVEMERALIELQEHRAVCLFASSEVARSPITAQVQLAPQDGLHNQTATAA